MFLRKQKGTFRVRIFPFGSGAEYKTKIPVHRAPALPNSATNPKTIDDSRQQTPPTHLRQANVVARNLDAVLELDRLHDGPQHLPQTVHQERPLHVGRDARIQVLLDAPHHRVEDGDQRGDPRQAVPRTGQGVLLAGRTPAGARQRQLLVVALHVLEELAEQGQGELEIGDPEVAQPLQAAAGVGDDGPLLRRVDVPADEDVDGVAEVVGEAVRVGVDYGEDRVDRSHEEVRPVDVLQGRLELGHQRLRGDRERERML